MGFLTERPPATVEVGGREVPVNADYRVMLRIDELPDGMPEAARGMRALQLFYGEMPADVDAAAAAGMDGFLPKPLDVNALYRLLRDLLRSGNAP